MSGELRILRYVTETHSSLLDEMILVIPGIEVYESDGFKKGDQVEVTLRRVGSPSDKRDPNVGSGLNIG